MFFCSSCPALTSFVAICGTNNFKPLISSKFVTKSVVVVVVVVLNESKQAKSKQANEQKRPLESVA